MTAVEPVVLAINPGSTSTKLGVFQGAETLAISELRHAEDELRQYADRPILDQQGFRRETVRLWLESAEVPPLDAVSARGGLLPPLGSGTYEVNEAMLATLARHERGEHASNLGAPLAAEVSAKASIPAFIVDPVSVDEWPDHVRLSGHPLLTRQCLSHALNTKAVAKLHANKTGTAYHDLKLVVAHLGSGISVSAHLDGMMIDVCNSREEGAFSTERAGGVPVMALVDLCFSGTHDRREIETLLFRAGGLSAYLGTRDLLEVERRIAAGDDQAALVFRAMAYQVSCEIGAKAAALQGQPDAILLTGGMARSQALVDAISAPLRWMADVHVYPGEDELRALADGALRVLSGAERVLEFRAP